MKRYVLFVLLTFMGAAVTFAGGWERVRGPGMFRQKITAENMTVSGNLTIAQGMIAIKNGDTTYYIRGLHRFVGFIDGLKEGAKVTIEGAGITNPNDTKSKMLNPVKLTINGKDYDLGTPESDNRADFGRPSAPPRRW